VQESLTNIIRHAGPARATVAVRLAEDGVEIEVTDDGRGAVTVSGNGDGDEPEGGAPGGGGHGQGSGGHGLAGMRERVALLGGELSAGNGRSGGYRVWAKLPL
jgi:signal transduction histidine kinase